LRLLSFERVDLRWRSTLELPAGVPLSGLTVGLLSDDGRPLGPAVVAPVPEGSEVVVDVRGPCSLPQGATLRVTIDVSGEGPVTHDLRVARRRGIHAWLHADSCLSVESSGKFVGLSLAQRRLAGKEWCWLAPADDEPGCTPCASESLPDEMAELLRDFGVDVDELSPELAGQLKAR
jgi:hypothetical protein